MGIGVWQVVLVLVIVLIIFGAGKLPRVAGDVAKGIKNFKKGLNEEDETAANTNQSVEPAAEAIKPTLDKDKAAQG